MENIGIALGITGGILGIAAFLGQWIIAFSKYVDLHINVEKGIQKTGEISVRVILENKTLLRKRVDFAALIISPENESTSITLQKISKTIDAPDNLGNNLKYLRAELTKPY